MPPFLVRVEFGGEERWKGYVVSGYWGRGLGWVWRGLLDLARVIEIADMIRPTWVSVSILISWMFFGEVLWVVFGPGRKLSFSQTWF